MKRDGEEEILKEGWREKTGRYWSTNDKTVKGAVIGEKEWRRGRRSSGQVVGEEIKKNKV